MCINKVAVTHSWEPAYWNKSEIWAACLYISYQSATSQVAQFEKRWKTKGTTVVFIRIHHRALKACSESTWAPHHISSHAFRFRQKWAVSAHVYHTTSLASEQMFCPKKKVGNERMTDHQHTKDTATQKIKHVNKTEWKHLDQIKMKYKLF